MLAWCRFVEVVAPVEVRNAAELAALADLVRRILKGETTLEREFPGYVYGKAQWAAEGLAERAHCLISHRLAGKGPRGTAAVETQTELSDEAGVELPAEKTGPTGGL